MSSITSTQGMSSSGLSLNGHSSGSTQAQMPFQDTFGVPEYNGLSEDFPGSSKKRRQPDGEGARKKRASVSAGDGESTTGKEKKKKASRACIHCQKAHLTCDDARPCQRCVKRGIADTCAEGQRKKAKYLLDDEELETLRHDKGKQVESPNGIFNDSVAASSEPPSSTAPVFQDDSSFDPFYNLSMDPSYTFGSTAANMEYSILSAILGNPSQHDDMNAKLPSPPPSTTVSNFPQQNPGWPNIPLDSTGMGYYTSGNGASTSNPVNGDLSPNSSAMYNGVTNSHFNNDVSQNRLSTTNLSPPTPPISELSSVSPPVVDTSSFVAQKYSSDDMQGVTITEGNRTSDPNAGPSQSLTSQVSQAQRIADVYTNVTEPFDYVDGYHCLMQYLQGRFDKMDILRIVRALAIFRPSLIALQMPLTRDDEIFVERAFQRTLIELEKLISYSGTPTAVWRRTGEICLVGMEFVMLTGWSHADLVDKHKFIYELFEHSSVVEYWEKFASHAFESSSQTVYSHSVLLKPSGEPIPCAFCFSIRRDVFDLPNVVIGQWLPLL